MNQYINIFKKIVPNLSKIQRKGKNGKIGFIGGSLEYTGAPYYGSMGVLRSGADLSFVFCFKEASIPIKSYSPDIIVIPLLPINGKKDKNLFSHWISIMHSITIGSGLGRD